MAADPTPTFVSISDYLRLDRESRDARYEYIDGHVRLRSDVTLRHATISVNVVAALTNKLSGECRVYMSNVRVQISARRFVYPDATVVCDGIDHETEDIVESPRIVVEVLSPSTESYDRGRKAMYYRACPSIEEIVLIDTERKLVEMQRRVGDEWKLLTFGPQDDIECASVRCRFPVTALYRNTTVPDDDEIEPGAAVEDN